MSAPFVELNEVAPAAAAEHVDELARSALGVTRELVAPVLVATDGSRASAAALRIAAALAARQGARIEALLVEESFPSSLEGVSFNAEALRLEQVPDASRIGRVRRQLCATLEENTWRLRVEFGRVGPTIADAARASGSPLIVMGLSRHRAARRLFSGEAVARVLRTSPVPVLAVAATTRAIPRSGVVGIDFSPASLRAARATAELLERPSTLHLVHVRPDDDASGAGAGAWDAAYMADASAKLRQLAGELSVNGLTAIERMETGNVTERLLRVATELNADLVACGTDSLNMLERLIIGHVPTQLLRAAECSVLIAPGASPDSQ